MILNNCVKSLVSLNGYVRYFIFMIILNLFFEEKHRCGASLCDFPSKYLIEIQKCKPDIFKKKIVCENDHSSLKCQKRGHKLAILSASYGYTSNFEECPYSGIPDNRYDECKATCKMDIINRRCLNKNKCEVIASTEFFGSTCHDPSSQSLELVYACLPKRIISKNNGREKNFELSGICDDNDHRLIEDDPPLMIYPNVNYPDVDSNPDQIDWYNSNIPDHGYTDVYDGDNIDTVIDRTDLCSLESYANSIECQEDPAAMKEEMQYIGFINDWIYTVKFISGNVEKFMLYLILSIFAGLILILLVIICRLIRSTNKKGSRSSLELSDGLPNSSRPTEDFYLMDAHQNHEVDGGETLTMSKQHNHTLLSQHHSTDSSLNNYFG